MRKTFKHILTEYGTIAVIVYFAIFFLVWGGFWMAIRFGWRSDGTAAGVGTLAAAYIATKLTQPLRIAATAVLTPVIGRLYERLRPASRRAPPSVPESPPGA